MFRAIALIVAIFCLSPLQAEEDEYVREIPDSFVKLFAGNPLQSPQFRGRTSKNDSYCPTGIKVLVVGQDSLPGFPQPVSFVSRPWEKVQGFLRAVGITQCYLFLGPLTAEMGDNLLGQYPSISLILTVGDEGRQSVQKYIEHRDRIRQPLEKSRIKVISLMDPRNLTFLEQTLGAGQGYDRLVNDAKSQFDKALLHDRLMENTDVPPLRHYRYESEPIPNRDLPFGYDRALIGGGSLDFQWNRHRSSSKDDSGYLLRENARCWEWNRKEYIHFDQGPGQKYVRLLTENVPALPETRDNLKPVFYRGQLGGNTAQILIIADQDSEDDSVTTRALSGDGGQKLQHFLANAGVRDYIILRTLWKSTSGLSTSARLKLNRNQTVRDFRARLIDEIKRDNNLEVVLTMGKMAKDALYLYEQDRRGNSWRAIHLDIAHPTQEESDSALARSWNSALREIRTKVKWEGAFREYSGSTFRTIRREIPRDDLPLFTPAWLGTSGSLASRVDSKGSFLSDKVAIQMPAWVAREYYMAKGTMLNALFLTSK